MEQSKEYFAFISYKSEDVEWATWLQHELEHYHLPASFNGRTDVPQELRPVFRDIDELSAGNLPEQIKQALVNSQNLIVICSPQAAKSPWVNQEVETFISLGRTDRIFPFIVEGNSPSEFFPPALRDLPKDEERLGGDVSKKGRDAAFVKIVAGMLGVSFDSLWNRYEKEKTEEERKQREQRDRLLISQSRFLVEKANTLVDEGDSITATILALEALPSDFKNIDRPFIIEAEAALRTCMIQKTWSFKVHHHYLFLSSRNYAFYLVTRNKDFLEITAIDFVNKKLQKKIKYQSQRLTGGILLHGKSIAFSAISYKFAFLEDRGSRITIVDIESNKVVLSINAYHSIQAFLESIYISKDGNYIIGERHKVNNYSIDYSFVYLYIWETISGRLIGQSSIQYQRGRLQRGGGIYKTIQKICIICKHIFIAWNDNIYIADLENPKKFKTLKGHSTLITDIDINKDGSRMVSISKDGEIIFWEKGMWWRQKHTIKSFFKFNPSTYTIGHVQFSPDNNSLLVSHGKEIYILDTNNYNIRKKIKGVSGNSVSYNGDFMVSSYNNDTIRIWDVSEKKLILQQINFSYFDKNIVWQYNYDTDKSPKLRPDTNPNVRLKYYYHGTDKSISSDRNRLVFRDASRDEIIVYDIKDNKIVLYTEFFMLKNVLNTDVVQEICLNDDGNLVAYILKLEKDNFRKKYYIEIWDVKTNQLRNRLDFFEEDTSIYSTSFLKTDMVTMIICTSAGLFLWKEYDQFPRKISDKNFFYCISGNSTRIIILCDENGMDVYDYGMNLFQTINLNCKLNYYYYHPVMSPDDNLIYLTWYDNNSYIDHIIERSTGKIVTRSANKSVCPNSFASFSADGKWILKCYGNEIHVIDAKTLNVLITYTPDITPRPEHHQSTQTFKNGNNQIDWAIFNKDGDTVLFSVDGDILYWEFPPINQISSEMRNLFKDNPLTRLTPEERRKYYLD